MMRTVPAAIALLTLLMSLGCSDSANQSAVEDSEMMADASAGAAAELAQVAAEKTLDLTALAQPRSLAGRFAPAAPAPAVREAPAQVVQTPATAAGAMLIRTGESRLEVDSIATGIAAVERAAAAADGWIAESSVSLGEHEHRSARLVVRVPAARWDDLVVGIRSIGEPRHLSTSTEDVGEQFVDLNAQLANAQRVEARYLELLRTRTGSLEDLLAVERELARVRERVETLQGRLRYLGERVAVSTMVVHLDQRTPILAADPGPNPLREAVREALRNFVAVIAGTIALAGGLLPLAVPLLALAWWWRRRRARRATYAAT